MITQVVNILEEKDAIDYTIIILASANNPATLQYISPYSTIEAGVFHI